MAEEHILVTGGTGFVGGHILNSLIELHPEYKITVFDLPASGTWVPPREDIAYVQGDIREIKDVTRAVREARPTAVIHVAGIVPTGNDRYSQRKYLKEWVFKVNVEGTKNMLEAARNGGVRAFVFTASITMVTDDNGHDYPNFDETIVPTPSLIYGQSKVAAEALVLEANSLEMATCSIRPSVICGPGDYQLVSTIQRCIAKFETPWIIGDGDGLYDFTYVTNVADAHVLAVHNLLTTKTAAGEAFFITNGQPIPFRAFCLQIWAHFGHTPPFEVHIPKPIAWVAAYCAEWVTYFNGTEATLSRGSVKDYCQLAYANIDKARRILGYEPRVSLDVGLKTSCDELRERLKAKMKGL
ncbi:C-3 sterol dehydrogenase/C-4 decarboxylase-like protein [Rhizodiscina lignyota]|uniref:C-3 sterol dehydrogenase/C-4 decarboxylase-like protein n=1 Tax=Rhizodiscina lignyota TaxID=1504668 RepID=A0A9P4M8R3_9PEZI|nr:C-3 sterol dehydrogenase/C-4 decarboxylase-like protein [Rhizodiscina lignyota]